MSKYTITTCECCWTQTTIPVGILIYRQQSPGES